MGSFTNNIFLMSIKNDWTIRGLTAGEGPIEFGVAHGDYSDAEIEEALEVTFQEPGDKIEEEHARRLVRRVGVLHGLASNEAYNDGREKKTKLNFVIQEDKGLRMWARNLSGAALTTGGVITITGNMFGKWLY